MRETDPPDKVTTPRWRVMGEDTFAREDYVIGDFDTEEDAKRCIREREERVALTQDEGLRDTFWIVRPD